MAGNLFVLSELLQESWQYRLARVSNETHELIAATRKVIDKSRECLVAADEILKRRP